MKVLIIDHYDSFSYNLQQYCNKLGAEVVVLKCDDTKLENFETLELENRFTHIIFSPGPGSVYNRKDVGLSDMVLQNCMKRLPILGVCLGHQLMGQCFGADVLITEPYHGKQEVVKIERPGVLFAGLGEQVVGMRYHSMVISRQSRRLLEGLGWTITAHAESDGCLMAMEHSEYKLFGIQFHPESVGTKDGLKILENFLSLT